MSSQSHWPLDALRLLPFLYLDKGHWEILGKVRPAHPVSPPNEPPASLLWCLIKHQDPKQIDDDQWPEILDRAEVKEGHCAHSQGRDPDQDRSSLKTTFDRQSNGCKQRHVGIGGGGGRGSTVGLF